MVMTIRYITLSAGTSNVGTVSVITKQFIIEINFEGVKITFKRSFDIQSYPHDHLSLVMRKPVFRVSDQVRHKPGFPATEDG